MRNFIILFLVAVVCAACVTAGNFKRFGTYTYEGVEYDVYTADEDDYLLGYRKTRVLIPKGVTPVAAAVIARCSASDSQATCDQIFARGIDQLFGQKRDEGGMY